MGRDKKSGGTPFREPRRKKMGGEKSRPVKTDVGRGTAGIQKGKAGGLWIFLGGGVDSWDHSGTGQNFFG